MQSAIEEEADEAPLGLEPSLAECTCPNCHGAVLDLGIENADKYLEEKRWYKCASCGAQWPIVTGPARIPKPKLDFHSWKFRADSGKRKRRG